MQRPVALHLVSVPGIERSHPYLRPDGAGWPDNTARFLAFSRAVAAMVRADPPDVLHLHDWHTGAVLAALPAPPPTVLDAAQHRLPGRHRRHLAAPHRSPWAPLRVVGRHQPAQRRPSPSPTASSRCRPTTPARSSRRPAGSAWTDRCGPAATPSSGSATGSTRRAGTRRPTRSLAAPLPAGGRGLLAARRRNRDAVLERVGWRDDGRPLAVMVHAPDGPEGRRHDPADRAGAAPRPDAPRRARRRARSTLARALAGVAADHPDVFAFVERHDEALARRMFGGGRRVPHAEPLRAVRAGPDGGHAVRRDPGRDARRRAPRHRARRRRITGRPRVRRRFRRRRRRRGDAVPGRPAARRPPPPRAARAADHGRRLVVGRARGPLRRRVRAARRSRSRNPSSGAPSGRARPAGHK